MAMVQSERRDGKGRDESDEVDGCKQKNDKCIDGMLLFDGVHPSKTKSREVSGKLAAGVGV